jgi:DNA-binding transcriptional LysR family regulator
MKQPYQTLSDMVLFVEVARCGSYRKAADRLEVPVATLSRRISAMEKRLGAQLLVRTTRSVALAHGAHAYYEQCLRVLDAAAAAQAVLVAGRSAAERIRVSMPVDLGVEILGPSIADYAAQHPGLQVEFDLATNARDLFRDPVDLVFRIGRPIDDRVVARKIGDVAAGLYMARSLQARLGLPSSAQDLVNMPCLELLTATGPMGWSVSQHTWGRAPGNVSLAANNMGLLHALAVQGHGVALLPRHLAGSSVQAGALVELLDAKDIPPWPLYAITASRNLSAHMRGLISQVRARLHGMAP